MIIKLIKTTLAHLLAWTHPSTAAARPPEQRAQIDPRARRVQRARARACACLRVCVCVRVCTQVRGMSVYAAVRVSGVNRAHVCVCVCACMRTRMYTYLHISRHTPWHTVQYVMLQCRRELTQTHLFGCSLAYLASAVIPVSLK